MYLMNVDGETVSPSLATKKLDGLALYKHIPTYMYIHVGLH